MRRTSIRRVAALASVLLGAGCGSARCPTTVYTEPAPLLEAHAATRDEAVSLRAEARVDQRGPEGRIKGTVLMFVERPDHVRFDAMTRFGPAAVLTSDGTRFQLNDLRENRYFEGPTCSANIARLLGIRMTGSEVARLLLGDSPRIADTRQTVECTGGAYRVELQGIDGSRQELRFSVPAEDRELPPGAQRLLLRRSEVRGPDGEAQWRVTYDDYRPVADSADPDRHIAMPFRVQFFDLQRDTDTLVRFQSIDLNVEVPPEAFVQEPRPGLPVEIVACE